MDSEVKRPAVRKATLAGGLLGFVLVVPFAVWLASAVNIGLGVGLGVMGAIAGGIVGRWFLPTEAPSGEPTPPESTALVAGRGSSKGHGAPTRDWLGLIVYGGALALIFLGGVIWILIRP